MRELIEQRDTTGLSFDDLLGRRLAALTAPVRSCLEAGGGGGARIHARFVAGVSRSGGAGGYSDLDAERFIEETEYGYRLQHD